MSNQAAKKPESFGFFNPKELGESLSEVAVDVIQTENQSVMSRWYHSDKEVDLFIWMDQKENVIKQQLYFCGQVVEWNILDGVKTGFTLEGEAKSEDKSQSGDEIQFDSQPQANAIQFAGQVLHNVLILEPSEREVLIKNLEYSPTASSMDPKEFLNKYGHPYVKSRTNGSIQRLWKAIHALFRSKK